MATIKFYDITKKEEDTILSLFRIPIMFFGTNKDDEDSDLTENETEDIDESSELIENENEDIDEDSNLIDDKTEDNGDDSDSAEDESENIDESSDLIDDENEDIDTDSNLIDDKTEDNGDDSDSAENESKDIGDDSDSAENESKDIDEVSDLTENESEDDDEDSDSSEDESKDNDNDSNSSEDESKDNDDTNDNNDKNDKDDANGNSDKNDKDDANDNNDKDGKDDTNDSSDKGNKNNAEEAKVSDVKGNDKSIENNKSNPVANKNSNSIDNARKMKPKDSSPSLDKKPMPKGEGNKNIPGADKALKAKNGLDAIKNAKDDPMGAVEKGGTELAKQGAKAIGNAVAPGAGEAAAKAVEVADKLLEKSELGRKSKKACCIGTLTCSCFGLLSSLAVFALPILLLIVIGNLIFDIFQVDNELEVENPEKNFVHVIEENTLNRPKTSLLDILEDALKDVGYYKQKEADEKGEEYEDENGSSTVFYALVENYSVSRLKFPLTDSKPEDFPEGEEDFEQYYIPNNVSPYFSMEKKHMPLFQDVLDNLLEEDYNKLSSEEQLKENTLKKLFNSEKKIVDFIDKKLTKELDKKYNNIYNPDTKLYENEISLRDIFEETSSVSKDAKYDIYTASKILRSVENKDLTKAYYDLQENLAKLEVMTYMQAFRQFNMARDTMIRNANSGGYILADVYFTDEFFTQFSTISDVATYFSLAMLCDDPSIVYEIAREHIYIYNDPIEVTVKDFSGIRAGYIPILKTWYGNYSFDLIQTGNDFILQCTDCSSKQIDEQSWDERSNILKRYSIDDKDQFFTLFMEATGIDPVEGKENIYSPYELDDSWQTPVTFDSGATRAYSSGIYSYKTANSSYSSNNNAPAGSPSYSYSTTTYLTESGGSFPLAASNVRITMNFMERYPQYIIDKYGTSEYHRGIDYAVPIGTPVLAIREGVVTAATPSAGYGNYVEITHPDGSRSRYGHGNGVFNVNQGDTVTAGTQIMESGNSGNSTGPHMHLEVIGPDGKLVDPNTYISGKPY